MSLYSKMAVPSSAAAHAGTTATRAVDSMECGTYHNVLLVIRTTAGNPELYGLGIH